MDFLRLICRLLAVRSYSSMIELTKFFMAPVIITFLKIKVLTVHINTQNVRYKYFIPCKSENLVPYI